MQRIVLWRHRDQLSEKDIEILNQMHPCSVHRVVQFIIEESKRLMGRQARQLAEKFSSSAKYMFSWIHDQCNSEVVTSSDVT